MIVILISCTLTGIKVVVVVCAITAVSCMSTVSLLVVDQGITGKELHVITTIRPLIDSLIVMMRLIICEVEVILLFTLRHMTSHLLILVMVILRRVTLAFPLIVVNALRLTEHGVSAIH